jgi:archaemetzincin
VFTDETGHMFGLYHCIHYECLMNGSNSLAGSNAAPLFLCPVCLRKLHAANAFDPVARYEKLDAFFQRTKLDGEHKWVTQRLAELRWRCDKRQLRSRQ